MDRETVIAASAESRKMQTAAQDFAPGDTVIFIRSNSHAYGHERSVQDANEKGVKADDLWALVEDGWSYFKVVSPKTTTIKEPYNFVGHGSFQLRPVVRSVEEAAEMISVAEITDEAAKRLTGYLVQNYVVRWDKLSRIIKIIGIDFFTQVAQNVWTEAKEKSRGMVAINMGDDIENAFRSIRCFAQIEYRSEVDKMGFESQELEYHHSVLYCVLAGAYSKQDDPSFVRVIHRLGVPLYIAAASQDYPVSKLKSLARKVEKEGIDANLLIDVLRGA